MKAAILFISTVSLSATACSYGEDNLPDCLSDNIAPSLSLLREAHIEPDETMALHHELCTTHYERLAVAEKILSKEGFDYEQHPAELGRCITVTIRQTATPENLRAQITKMCAVTSAARIRYGHWSGRVGDKFLFADGKYTSAQPDNGPPHP